MKVRFAALLLPLLLVPGCHGAQGNGPAWEVLQEKWQSGGVEDRRDVMLELLVEGVSSPPARDLLLRGARDPDALVRGYAAEAMGKLDEDGLAFVPTLLALQQDPDSLVRSAAHEALNRLDPPPHLAVREPVQPIYQEVDAQVPVSPERREFRPIGSSEETHECWEFVSVPAVYAKRRVQLLIASAGWTWRRSKPEDLPQPANGPQPAWMETVYDTSSLPEDVRNLEWSAKVGDILCRVVVPAMYETRKVRVLVQGERHEEGRLIPARYEEVLEQVCVQPATVRLEVAEPEAPAPLAVEQPAPAPAAPPYVLEIEDRGEPDESEGVFRGGSVIAFHVSVRCTLTPPIPSQVQLVVTLPAELTLVRDSTTRDLRITGGGRRVRTGLLPWPADRTLKLRLRARVGHIPKQVVVRSEALVQGPDGTDLASEAESSTLVPQR